MLYQGTLYIDGEKAPTPQTFDWNWETLNSEEGTGRNNATGEMFIDRVATKRKLIFTWPPLSVAETSRLLKMLDPVFITARYFDAKEGGYVTKTFYSGPQAASCGHRGHWLGIKANLIEK